jgi:chromosome partitioning protein
MPVIAFVSPKGGAGKTTAALLLALELAHAGRRVRMIDADPNHPLVRWRRDGGAVDGLDIVGETDDAKLSATIRAAASGASWVIVDTEGAAVSAAAHAIAAADLVVIPTGPSALDAQEAVKAVALVRVAERKLGRPIPHAALLTRLPAAIRSKALKAMVEDLLSEGVAILPHALVEKEAYRVMFALARPLRALTPAHVSGVETAIAHAEGLLEVIVAAMAGAEFAEAAP